MPVTNFLLLLYLAFHTAIFQALSWGAPDDVVVVTGDLHRRFHWRAQMRDEPTTHLKTKTSARVMRRCQGGKWREQQSYDSCDLFPPKRNHHSSQQAQTFFQLDEVDCIYDGRPTDIIDISIDIGIVDSISAVTSESVTTPRTGAARAAMSQSMWPVSHRPSVCSIVCVRVYQCICVCVVCVCVRERGRGRGGGVGCAA